MLGFLYRERRLIGRAVLAWFALGWLSALVPSAAACPAWTSPAHHAGEDQIATHDAGGHCPGCGEHGTAPDPGGINVLTACHTACAVQPGPSSLPTPTPDGSHALAPPVSVLSAAEWTGQRVLHPSPPRGLPLSPVLEFRVLLI